MLSTNQPSHPDSANRYFSVESVTSCVGRVLFFCYVQETLWCTLLQGKALDLIHNINRDQAVNPSDV